MYSRLRRACYPRGSLFVSLDPQQKGFQGSLSPSFESEFHAFKNSVSPAFVFNPYQRISDPPKQSIGRPCFLIEGVPPQPNYPSADVPFRVRNTAIGEQCFTFAFAPPARDVSTLLLTLCNNHRIPTTDYSKAPRGLRFPLEVLGIFTE